MGKASAAQRDRVRVLAFVTDFRVGGTERQFATFARALDPSRFELHVACFRRVGDFFEDVLPHVASVHEYGIRRLYHPATLLSQARLAHDLRRLGIQVFQSFGFYPNVFGLPAARLAGTPVALASIRDTGDHLTPLQRRLQRVVCRVADGILVNAEAVRERLVTEGYNPRSISVIHNGIAAAPPDAQPSPDVRGALGLPPGARVITLLSRLTRLKGAEYFLEAAALIARRFEDVRFLVVGDGPPVAGTNYRTTLEHYAALLGITDRVVFTGLRADVRLLLRESTVSVLPSLSEGLSNVLLESMAAGIPVVATRVGGNPEAVEDGVSGILVPSRDALALAAALERLLDDPELAARMGRAGRERVAGQFSVEQMVRRTEDVYAQFLGRRKSAPFATRRLEMP
jgi:glycosyltransferase involved in cell wall biosynthesis